MIQKLEKKLSGYKSNLKQISENYDKAVKLKNNAMSNRLKGEMFILELVIDEIEPIVEKLSKSIKQTSLDYQVCEELLTEAQDHMDNTHSYESEIYGKITKYFGN